MLLDWLWPVACAGCGREGVGRVCPTCAGSGLRSVAPTPEGLRGAWSLGPYDGPLGAAVRRAKYRPDRHVAVALGALLASHARDLPIVDFVVPVPSTARSRAQRGFATSALLARSVGRSLGVPVVHALSSTGAGPKQAASSSRERRSNLKGRVISHRVVPGRVLLVDDVVTTGATAAACARALLCDGTRSVWLLTICATLVQLRTNFETSSDTSTGKVARISRV